MAGEGRVQNKVVAFYLALGVVVDAGLRVVEAGSRQEYDEWHARLTDAVRKADTARAEWFEDRELWQDEDTDRACVEHLAMTELISRYSVYRMLPVLARYPTPKLSAEDGDGDDAR